MEFRKGLVQSFCAISVLALLPTAGSIAADDDGAIARAIADTSRPEAARARDESRKPAEILAFAGVKPGQTIVEIAPGGGYYTGLLSRLVGPEGRIVAVDPERIFEHFPNGRDGFPNYLLTDPLENVDYSSQNLDAIDIPDNVDQVWMVLYYHDTLWTGEDRALMNQRFFDALKPGGVYLVVDHHGLKGAGTDITRELHRMDAETARDDLEAAGFHLQDESDVLANPKDPRNDSVFGEGRRGKTDRFVWRYVKPK